MSKKLAYVFMVSAASALIFSPFALAAQFLPSFTGYWYTAARYRDQDACYQSAYDYRQLASYSAKDYAAWVLREVPKHPDCQWGEAFFKGEDFARPYDFMGANQDWQSILQQSTAVTGQVWQRLCLAAKERIIDSRRVTIWPKYACPTGTHFYQGMQRPLCTDEETSCAADMVARDLLEPKILANTGYVGLTLVSHGLASVLAAKAYPDAILEQALTEFKLAAPFWGEKYGLAQKPQLTALEANNIIQAIKNQQDLGFNYTLGWQWYSGFRALHLVYDEESQQWRQIYGIKVKPLFRNDSLLYYSYLKGAAIKLLPGGFQVGVLPVNLYQAFLYPRFTSKAHSSLGIKPNAYDESMNETAGLDDPAVPRLEKLSTLLTRSKQQQNSPIIFEYLIDTLFELKPIELTDALIALYHQQTLIENKYRLLARLDELALLIADEPDDQRNLDIPKVLAIQHLYDAILKVETIPQLLKMAMQKYPVITKPDKAKMMIDLAFQRIEQERLKIFFTTAELTSLRLQLAFATKDTQARDVPLLITTPEDSGKLPYLLCAWLQTMPSDEVNTALKPSLKNYLGKHQAQIIDTRDLQAPMPTCNWLSAYATVSVEQEKEKAAFMLNTIRRTESPLLQARYLSQQPIAILSELPPMELQHYQQYFHRRLTDPSLSDADRQLLKMALSHLNAV